MLAGSRAFTLVPSATACSLAEIATRLVAGMTIAPCPALKSRPSYSALLPAWRLVAPAMTRCVSVVSHCQRLITLKKRSYPTTWKSEWSV